MISFLHALIGCDSTSRPFGMRQPIDLAVIRKLLQKPTLKEESRIFASKKTLQLKQSMQVWSNHWPISIELERIKPMINSDFASFAERLQLVKMCVDTQTDGNASVIQTKLCFKEQYLEVHILKIDFIIMSGNLASRPFKETLIIWVYLNFEGFYDVNGILIENRFKS